MAIRVIEVPSSVRFDPPPRLRSETRREPTISMKKPVGVLGMTDEERAELMRTKKWPARQVEAPEAPLALSLASLPSQEYLRGLLDGLRQSRQKGPKGRRSELDKRITRALGCLEEKGWRTEEARKRYVELSKVTPDTASRQFSEALAIIQTLRTGD
jgi:hypothetical protein